MSNEAHCDKDVFDNGESVGFVDTSSHEADELCKKWIDETGRKHDWHFAGGRVHVMALMPEYIERKEKIAECERLLGVVNANFSGAVIGFNADKETLLAAKDKNLNMMLDLLQCIVSGLEVKAQCSGV